MVKLLVVIALPLSILLQSHGADGFNFCSPNDTVLRLVENGYKTVHIRIAEDVPENYNLISNLENMLKTFSSTLFKLTKNRAYLKEVKILLPRSWEKAPPKIQRKIKTEATDSQTPPHIWIRNSSPRRENNTPNMWRPGDPTAFVMRPYTLKATPCGHAGSYIRLSPEFILFGNEVKVKEKLGPPEKILASEWAKLRWGVYDETPRDPIRGAYYHLSNRLILPTMCSASIEGDDVNVTSPQEQCNLQKAVSNGGCRFEPKINQENATFASLLYRTDLPYIDDYCDEDDGAATKRNVHAEVAPTKHNLHCRGQSVWKLMRSHLDFANGNNPSVDLTKLPDPNIKLVKVVTERIVLVLDVSSSMLEYGRLGLMRQAVGYFIDTVPLNTWVGIVCFSRTAKIIRELEQITSDEKRRWLKDQSMCNVGSGTSIGSGISQGIDVLSKSGPEAYRENGGKIIVLTDGMEHFRPKIEEAMIKVRHFRVTVTTIAFGGQVARNLEDLAHESNGRTYAASSGEYGVNSELQEAFSSQQQNFLYGGAVVVFSDELQIRRNSTKEQEFVIDSTIGKNTLVTIFYQENVQVQVLLKSPEGVNYFNGSDEDVRFSVDSNLNITYIRILNEAQSGTWVIRLINPFQRLDMIVRISVISYQRDQDPLGVSPALLCQAVNAGRQEALVVYVYVSIGEYAVLNASVGVFVTRPLISSESQDLVDTRQIVLKDNGLDPDVTANDGVYSGYFVDFTSAGRYMVKAYANNEDGKARLDQNYLLGVGNVDFPVVSFDTRNLTSFSKKKKRYATKRNRRALQFNVPLESFNRVTSLAGAFFVQNFPEDERLCGNGYKHFQKSCYKIFTTPQSSFANGRRLCQDAGGDLAFIKTKHAFSWLARLVQSLKGYKDDAITWFKDIDEYLQRSNEVDIERITREIKRDVHDFDLDQLVTHIAHGDVSEEDLENFDPDVEGMTNQQVNRLLSKLGLESREELNSIAEVFSDNSSPFRRKRQVSSLVVAANISSSSNDPPSLVTSQRKSPTFEPKKDAITLSDAKRQPEYPEPDGSGEEVPNCFWFQGRKTVASKGDICEQQGNFICEKPVQDRYPPSRVLDLQANFEQKSKTLSLRWSAPGDDLNLRTAAGYVLRTLGTEQGQRVLANNFTRGDEISLAAYQSQSNFPGPAGSPQNVVLNISENIACPPHAILDVIFALPAQVVLPNMTSQKELILLFVDEVMEHFKVDIFNVQLAGFALTSPYLPLFNFGDNLNRTAVIQRLNSTIDFTESSNTTTESEIVEFLSANGGRPTTPKVLVVVTDENFTQFVNISGIDTLIIISIGNYADKDLLWDAASEPGCKNSFDIENIDQLPSTSMDVAMRLCEARSTELWAASIIAYDDVDLVGRPSNVESFLIDHTFAPAICTRIIPTTVAPGTTIMVTDSPTPAPAGASATVIGLSIGIPFVVILIVVGSVMLFGQLKKFVKRRKKKKKEEEEKKLLALREARRKRAKAKAAKAAAVAETKAEQSSNGGAENNNNNNSKSFKRRLFESWSNPSKVNPIV